MLVPELTFESEWVLKAVSHQLRRKILNLIYDYSFLNYSDLLRELDLTTGKLNFHLKQLTGLIEKQRDGEYRLTPIGEKALEILKQVYSISEDEDQVNYFQTLQLGITIEEFRPGVEAKRANYLAISLFFALPTWISLMFVAGFVDFIIIANISSIAFRKIVNASIFTGIIILVLLSILFLVKLYIESIKYEVLDTELVIRKGIITKKHTIIPYRTITNLLSKRSPFDRLFGISKIIIQTAGESASAQPEGRMIGVYYPHDLLEEILNLVRLLDPPIYLREKAQISVTPAVIRELYIKILEQLQAIDEKISE
ncbi:MAG: PH domain-containing protein [Candidatus Thorarchaeota archaeon]